MVPAVAVNEPVAAPALTATDAGTLSSGLFEESVTTTPPAGAGCDIVTVHMDVPLLFRVEGLHDSVLRTIGALKVKLTGMVTLPDTAVTVAV